MASSVFPKKLASRGLAARGAFLLGDKVAAPSPGPECEIYLEMSRSGTLGE